MKIIFFLYTLLIYLITPFILLRLKLKSFKNADYAKRINERFGFYNKSLRPACHDIWIHAVSFGEVEVAQILIRHWCSQGKRVLVTTTTPTGSRRVKALFAKEVTHVYLPFEWPGAIKRFLKRFNPSMLVIIETELWPNLIKVCSDRKVPIIITNARLSLRSVRGYAYISFFIEQIIKKISLILAQSAEDGERFIELGAERSLVNIAGNLKFDAADNSWQPNKIKKLRNSLFAERPIFIAASTHPGEEELILKSYLSLLKKHTNSVLILAPRHPERAEDIIKQLKALNLGYICRTQKESLPQAASIYILDTLGELQLFYQLSDIAFVGGSLVPHGGHNVLEPIRANIPVIVGQHMHNFSFITNELLKNKGLIQVVDETQLAEEVDHFFEFKSDTSQLVNSANEFLNKHKGAFKRNIKAIESFCEGSATYSDFK